MDIQQLIQMAKNSELLEALRRAEQRSRTYERCEDCPLVDKCPGVSNDYPWCEVPFEHEAEWLNAYRNRKEQET